MDTDQWSLVDAARAQAVSSFSLVVFSAHLCLLALYPFILLPSLPCKPALPMSAFKVSMHLFT